MSEYRIVKTKSGMVRGSMTKSGCRFLGIPYAHAERFRAPQPASWTGVFDASEYGMVPAQPNFHGKWPKENAFRLLGGEDCQNLNIWTPDTDPEKPYPVLVYIHGGAFQSGSGNGPECAGEAFCGEAPIVYVTVNERVGVLGYLETGRLLGPDYEGSSNNGIRDVIEALQWIHENIAGFGGDPGRVTLMGTSAGAKLIASLLTNPASGSLFHQIIVESGATQSLRSAGTALRIAERFRDFLGKDADHLLTMSTEQLMRAQAEFCDSDGATCYFGPVFDERLFFENWKEAWGNGAAWKGKALIGSCLHELSGTVHKPDFPENRESILKCMFGSGYTFAEQAREELRTAVPEMDEGDAWTKVMSDYMYRTYSQRLAELLTEAGDEVWMYSFDLAPAVHGMGQAVSLGKYESALPGTDLYEMECLTRHMKMRFMEFCISGTPDRADLVHWPSFRERKKLLLDIPCRITDLDTEKPLECFPEYVFSL